MSTRCTLGVLVLLAGACLAPAAKGEEQKAEEKGHGPPVPRSRAPGC